jgi:histidinol dehydrogenase
MRIIATKGRTPQQIADEIAAPATMLVAEQERTVRAIVDDVRDRGDEAVLEYTRRFDCPTMTAGRMLVTEKEFARAREAMTPEFLAVVRDAADHVRAFHEKQLPTDWFDARQPGVVLGQKFTPVQRAGLHIPGFTAVYPSSLIMTVVPGQVAGVDQIVMVTPPGKDGAASAATLATAGALGVSTVYKVGGAQAIAALAYGTETIPKVDKVFGPGSIWVTLAKKLVYGDVGIEGLYGPSEVVVLADAEADARLIAADLLAQAEHNVDSPVFLVTPSEPLAESVQQELKKQLRRLSRRAVARESLEEYGAMVVTRTMDEAVEVVNELAAEHVQVHTQEPFALLSRIRNAGAIFLGDTSPVPLGDYVIGPSHVLPTGGTARFSSGLGVMDFMKRSSIVYTSREAVRDHASVVETLGAFEGLEAHVRAVKARLRPR